MVGRQKSELVDVKEERERNLELVLLEPRSCMQDPTRCASSSMQVTFSLGLGEPLQSERGLLDLE